MTLSIERADRRMGLASDRTVYSSKRNRPLLLYGRLLDDSRPSHGLTATNPDYFLFVQRPPEHFFFDAAEVKMSLWSPPAPKNPKKERQ
jgi:hypothetical protein